MLTVFALLFVVACGKKSEVVQPPVVSEPSKIGPVASEAVVTVSGVQSTVVVEAADAGSVTPTPAPQTVPVK
jgi:hypothetical protein